MLTEHTAIIQVAIFAGFTGYGSFLMSLNRRFRYTVSIIVLLYACPVHWGFIFSRIRDPWYGRCRMFTISLQHVIGDDDDADDDKFWVI